MLLLFSRPIEFSGFFAFLYIISGFVIVSLVSELLRQIAFWSQNKTILKSEEIRSWLTGFAWLGFVFLIANLLLAIPVIILLFFIQISIFEPIFGSSDETFHKIDNFLTVLGILINLIFYFLAVKIYHRRIYSRFLERSMK